jgi:mono/diheme cytochrome c family protein
MLPYRGFLRINGFAALLLFAGSAGAQETADYYRQNCLSCHTIGGGRLTGPDLKDVSGRKDRAWLIEFMLAPQRMIDRGDPYALQLLQESRGVVMPQIAGLDRARAEALMDLIDAESAADKSQFAGVQISDRPLTAQDIEQGRRIMLGTRKLANGGPSCLGCHTIKGLGGLGGGRLGPDLTRVYERLSGRKNLGAWLTAPATPTMAAVFRNHALTAEEILPLIGVFEEAAKNGGEDDSSALVTFLLFGMGGAVVGLVVLDTAWRRRFRAVRAPLVGKQGRGNHEVD